MSYDRDEMLRDFLVESREIIEELSEHLVELETNYLDGDLLNAIFRGFHTLKGSAGFINITELVACCHLVENIFDRLRSGTLSVTTELIDGALHALDVVQSMRDQLEAGETVTPMPASLVASLTRLAESENPDYGDAPENDYERFIDELANGAHSPPDEKQRDDIDRAISRPQHEAPPSLNREQPPDADDQISDEEFESLLDQLYGKNGSPTKPRSTVATIADEQVPAQTAIRQPLPRGESERPKLQSEETSIRIETHRLDEIVNLVGEMVLLRNRLATLLESSRDEQTQQAVMKLDALTADLQTSVMKTRVQPIKKVFGRFPRMVRDLAKTLQKEIALEIIGEETELDKKLVDALADPLIHLIRNSIDHGIETTTQRAQLGKPQCGKIVLSAEQEGDQVLLKIIDDGQGISVDSLREQLVASGIHSRDYVDDLSDEDCYQLIFLPGLSTKTDVTDISGRGVGMDAVKTRISQLNGTIQVMSTPGLGTEMRIRVPLTLAIMPTLMVTVGGQVFALPLVSVEEIINVDIRDTDNVAGRQVMLSRGKPLPLCDMRDWLRHNEPSIAVQRKLRDAETQPVVLVEVAGQIHGLIVDKLLGQEEVVIKPLDRLLTGTPGVSGATITGEGNIALVLDVAAVVQLLGNRMTVDC